MNAPLGENPQDLTGKNVVDKQGTKVGSIQQIYRDDATDAPEWITVRTGLFGMKETFVPLAAPGVWVTSARSRTPRTRSRTRRGSTRTATWNRARRSGCTGTTG